MRHVVYILILALGISGCWQKTEPLHVASKNFSENAILAEMFVLLAGEAGIPVKKTLFYGNTFDLQEAAKDGRVDLYPEYTGTGLSMMGMPAVSDGEEAMLTLRDLFERYGLEWLDRLGFNNSYILVVQPELAARLDITSISDLGPHTGVIRIGCEEEFLARPVDGFQPLVRRYGFSPEPATVTVESRDDLYRGLVAGSTDVIVVQRTDPQIEEFGLTVLMDDLGFFPSYEAAPLARSQALARFPRLGDVLGQLAGRIDDGVMRELNSQVELDGLEERTVAVRFLVENGLISREPPQPERRELVLSVPPGDPRSTMLARALDAIRRSFPNRQVEVVRHDSPPAALAEGEALMAMIGAEHFFSLAAGQLPELREGVEAVAPVGFHMAHLVRHRDTVSRENPFAGIDKLGVGPEHGSADYAAAILLDGYEKTETISTIAGNISRQAEEVEKGELDALLIMAAKGEAETAILLDKHPGLRLQPLLKWDRRGREYRYPFLRRARIPAGTYPHVDTPVETVGSQVVLAGPQPEAPVLGDGDPVSGLQSRRQAIPRGFKAELISNLGSREVLDPTLPGERVAVVTARRDVQPLNPAPGISALTALLMATLGMFFYLLFKRRPRP